MRGSAFLAFFVFLSGVNHILEPSISDLLNNSDQKFKDAFNSQCDGITDPSANQKCKAGMIAVDAVGGILIIYAIVLAVSKLAIMYFKGKTLKVMPLGMKDTFSKIGSKGGTLKDSVKDFLKNPIGQAVKAYKISKLTRLGNIINCGAV